MSLRKNISWSLIGNSIYAASQWGILIVLAHVGGTSVVGRFSLGLAITAPVMLFSNIALRQVLVTDAKEEYRFCDYLTIRIVTALIGMFIVVVIALVGYTGEVVGIIIALGFAKSIEAVSDILYGLQQRQERLNLVACSMILRGCIGLTSFSSIYFLTGSLFYGVLGLALAWTMVLLAFDFPQALLLMKSQMVETEKFHCFNLRSRTLWYRLIWMALPLGFATTLVSLNTNMPRYFIEYHLGEESLGLFASMAYLAVLGGMVINSVWQASSPRLANYATFGEMDKFTKLLKQLVLIAFGLGSGGIIIAAFWGDYLLVLLYGVEFYEASGLFVPVMIGATISYMAAYLGSALMPLRLFRHQALLMLIVVAVNAVTCHFLVPNYGLVGAVIGWSCALIVYALLSLFVVIRAIHLKK